jgi:lipid II:glycine glycyltransferase (peptidoglycan interpeptide bridge formation enzyme)
MTSSAPAVGQIQMREFDTSAGQWDELVACLPGAHVLQSWQWGQVKAQYGWQASYMIWEEMPDQGQKGRPPDSIAAAALFLRRTLSISGRSLPYGVAYLPKGPLLRNWGDLAICRKVLVDVIRWARSKQAIFVKIDPDVPLGVGVPGTEKACTDEVGMQVQAELQSLGWRYSPEQIQFRNTVLVNLRPAEEELLARMKQKTRYNIRLAARKGVTVRVGGEADIPVLYQMYAETSVRDGFVIRDAEYYQTVWGAFLRQGIAEPLIAEVGGEPVAAVVIFRYAGKAWYLYGMSRTIHREKMPNYLLQWEAMRRAKAAGCEVYDLWGAPEQFDEQDPLWGVYRFKRGLGGTVVRTLGAWDYPVRPVWYWLYSRVLPRVLDVMRTARQARTRREISPGGV